MNFQDIRGRYAQIKEFPDYYISEYGEVFSERLRGREKEKKLRRLKPKNPGRDSKYLNIILCNDAGQFTRSIHRLVAEYFVDGYFDGAVVNHIDGNNRNNIASNLEWTTISDNIRKSYQTSGVGPIRNYKIWQLFNPSGELVEVFNNHMEMEEYVRYHKLNAAPTQLTRNRNSRGYTIITNN